MTDSPLRTRQEAIRYLRLDVACAKPGWSLDYYRRTGRLRGIKIGRHVMFRQEDLDRFIEQQQESVPV